MQVNTTVNIQKVMRTVQQDLARMVNPAPARVAYVKTLLARIVAHPDQSPAGIGALLKEIKAEISAANEDDLPMSLVHCGGVAEYLSEVVRASDVVPADTQKQPAAARDAATDLVDNKLRSWGVK